VSTQSTFDYPKQSKSNEKEVDNGLNESAVVEGHGTIIPSLINRFISSIQRRASTNNDKKILKVVSCKRLKPKLN
jgi:CRISPR/Cas system CSM-associated protein Csm2 small subunit